MTSYVKIVLLVLIAGITTLVSCKKKYPYPSKDYPNTPISVDTSGLNRWGEFVLTDGVMYIENSETGEKSKFYHFSGSKSRSSLRWGGSLFAIENIIKDSTTWSFYAPIGGSTYGKFVLNGDTSKYYMVKYTGIYTSIIEDPTHNQQNLGGSSRPFSSQTISISDKTVKIEIEDIEGSINGYNCRYWSELTFKKIKEW